MNQPITDRFKARRRWGFALLAAALLVVGAGALSFGAVAVPLNEVGAVIAQKLGLGRLAVVPGDQAVGVVWGLRMPRLLLGILVGGALGATGAGMQGVLRNDLADPHLLGLGPGAAIGAALGAGAGGVQGAIAGGVAAGVLTSFAIRRLGRAATADSNRLVLAGVALGATMSAWAGFVVFGSDRSVVPPIEFWLLGSLSGATWRAVGTVVIFLVVGIGGLFALAKTLDLLALGNREASHLGVDVPLMSTMSMMLIGLAVGATVGVVGVIVFVGLLVPRLVRPVTGPHYRHILIGAILGGAVFVSAADLVARLTLEPIEIPVGLVTSVVGGPVFLWLITRRRPLV